MTNWNFHFERNTVFPPVFKLTRLAIYWSKRGPLCFVKHLVRPGEINDVSPRNRTGRAIYYHIVPYIRARSRYDRSRSGGFETDPRFWRLKEDRFWNPPNAQKRKIVNFSWIAVRLRFKSFWRLWRRNGFGNSIKFSTAFPIFKY